MDTILARIPPTPPNHEQIIAFNEAGVLPDGRPDSVGGRSESLCSRLIPVSSVGAPTWQQRGSVTRDRAHDTA